MCSIWLSWVGQNVRRSGHGPENAALSLSNMNSFIIYGLVIGRHGRVFVSLTRTRIDGGEFHNVDTEGD